ncbi:unnamed protein product [Orchesella dallaii]|uniref:Galectin n=1 Tax=Orchesella dallaii TaxID=48710 RepID=A0ABP1PI85_9HEXA
MLRFCFLIVLTFTLQVCHSKLVKIQAIPFITKLDNGLSVGDKITVTGRVLPTASNRFEINIRYGWRETAGGIFLFHFDMRFPKSHVVTDAQIDGPGWLGYQITNFTSHFRKGNDFLVEIICEKDKFHVNVDGDYFLEYKYKLPLKIADILHLSGVQERDVQVYSVDVNNLSNATKWVYPSAKTNFDLNESGTSDNNCTCDSESPFLVVFFILFVVLSIVFFSVILWLKGWLDFCKSEKLCICLYVI